MMSFYKLYYSTNYRWIVKYDICMLLMNTVRSRLLFSPACEHCHHFRYYKRWYMEFAWFNCLSVGYNSVVVPYHAQTRWKISCRTFFDFAAFFISEWCFMTVSKLISTFPPLQTVPVCPPGHTSMTAWSIFPDPLELFTPSTTFGELKKLLATVCLLVAVGELPWLISPNEILAFLHLGNKVILLAILWWCGWVYWR